MRLIKFFMFQDYYILLAVLCILQFESELR
jgi:hypothetical protein